MEYNWAKNNNEKQTFKNHDGCHWDDHDGLVY